MSKTMIFERALDPAPVAAKDVAARKRGDDNAMLKAAAGLTRDLNAPNAAIYWADMLGSAALGYGALALTIVADSTPVAIVAAVVSILAIYRAGSFIHELTHLKPNAIPGFRLAWNAIIGVPLLAPSFMLYCRERIYPLGFPNSISHFITAVAVVLRQVFGFRASFLPPEPAPLSVSVRQDDAISGRFAFLFVTTLEKLLLSSEVSSGGTGPLKFVAVEQNPVSMLRAFGASLVGRLGRTKLDGVHIEEADEIAIEGESSQVILDGETFRAGLGKPILLRPAQPLSFVRIAA